MCTGSKPAGESKFPQVAGARVVLLFSLYNLAEFAEVIPGLLQ
jgi:hypothetical protein